MIAVFIKAYTVKYDCETNFAPVSIFSVEDLLKYR